MKTNKDVRALFELMGSPVKEEFIEWLDNVENYIYHSGKLIVIGDIDSNEWRLKSLNEIKEMFDLQSDVSTRCNGYKTLCDMIKRTKEFNKQYDNRNTKPN